MDYKLRIIIEKVDCKTNAVVEKKAIAEYKINSPKKIIDLGMRHKEQISLLKNIQQYMLNEQSILISTDINPCPSCGGKLKRIGYKGSNFHAVFSDHKLKIQRYICSTCNKRHIPSVKSMFGTSIHPDLYKLQCELGSTFSFFKSESQLTELCQEKRSINNHERIKQTVNSVGKELCEANITVPSQVSSKPAKELIVQIDGGHIKDKNPSKRSFEALTAKIYNPEAVINIGKDRTKIIDKTCIASAKNDKNKTMKLLVTMATKKQGLTSDTKVTVIADGAKNCWDATEILSKECGEVEYILDWFHITKKFQPLLNHLTGEEKAKVESIKWNLWHGKHDKALEKLSEALKYFSDKNVTSKLKHIQTYLISNIDKLVHYEQRQKKSLVFTSSVAESTVEHIINDRYKKNHKMQWTRESAHNILQIRTSVASKEWNNVWENAVTGAIKQVA